MIPYHQTTPFTTAASSLLTILHHLQPEIPLTKEMEFDIWQKTVTLPTRGSSIFGLANYAKELGLKVKVVLENKQYDFPDYRFYGYKKSDIELAAFSSELHLQRTLKNQIPIEEKTIKIEDIEQELKQDHLLMLRINAKPIRQDQKRNTSNYIVVLSFIDNYFQIIDPTIGALSVPKEIMLEAFQSLETKKHQDHRMIVFYINYSKPTK
jgi:hypothetical protein